MGEAAKPELRPVELAPLRRQDNHHSALHLTGVAAGLLATIAVCHGLPSVLLGVPAAVLIGALQHHLLIAQQEALQYLLFRERRLNDLVGDAAAALLFITPQQRWARWHGRGLLDEDRRQPIPRRRRVVLGVLLHLCGAASLGRAVARGRAALARRSDRNATPAPGWWRRMLLVQSIVAGALLLMVGWRGYVGLWLVPRFCVLPALVYVRDVVARDTTLCTVRCGLIEAFFLAPMNAGYGAERQLCRGVPWHGLPRCHRMLSGRPGYDEAVTLRRGYLRSIWRDEIGGPDGRSASHSAAA